MSFTYHDNQSIGGGFGIRMKRFVAVFLISLLVSSLIAAYFFLPHTLTKATVAIVLYVWYGARLDDWTRFVDFPVADLGNYSSLNETVVRQQLALMEDLVIDLVLISWWGFEDDYEKFVNNATRLVFETAKNVSSPLKFAVMVEPTHSRNESSNFGEPYDYAGIYNYVYETFVETYPAFYYNYSGQPLICFFNDDILTHNGEVPPDSRFAEIIVGDQNYTQWTFSTNEFHTNQISIISRFDDSRIRPPGREYDVDLSNHTYDLGWQKAIQLWGQGKINTILVTSWNEYPERTEIEPHYDHDYNETMYNNATYYLYNKTKEYITQVQGPSLTDLALFAVEIAATFAITFCVFSVVTAKMMAKLEHDGEASARHTRTLTD